jgi:hypothetical protein
MVTTKPTAPQIDDQAFTMDPSPEVYLRWQWVVDPPWILRHLREDIVQRVIAERLRFLAKENRLRADFLQSCADMVEKTG